jgi:uncharacterized protein (TIGR03083 family)
VDLGELYRDVRERTLALGAELSDDDTTRAVPTCPEWRVRDVFAHLAGVSADILAGRVEGAATDPWTARQVAERADTPFAEILTEWEANGPEVDAFLAPFGDDGMVSRVPIDAWTHEQDIRTAVERPGGRDAPVVAWAAPNMVARFAERWTSEPLAPVRIVGSSQEWLLGDGEPVATLRVSDYELVRLLVGRRSRAQAVALWDGEGEPFVDSLIAFTFASTDIDE